MSAPPSPRFYLCVDGGGTKTAVALARPTGEIVARAYGGPSNFTYIGIEAFLHEVATTVTTALSIALSLPASTLSFPSSAPLTIADQSLYTISAAWLGISGIDSPSAMERLTPHISTLLGVPAGPRLAITNDVHLLGAPLTVIKDVRSAVTCIGGTGSIVVSFKESRMQGDDSGVEGPLTELARVGGWGWILGDEGGGFDVGRTAVRTLLGIRDAMSFGGPAAAAIEGKKTLNERVMERFGITDILDVLGAVHMPDPPAEGARSTAMEDYTAIPREKRLSALSPLVFAAAFEDGDPVARQVLKECAGKLAAQIAAVLSVGTATRSDRKVPASESVLCFGGSLVGIEAYRNLVLDALKDRGHVFKYVEVVADAAGAGARGLVHHGRAFDSRRSSKHTMH